MRHGIKHRKLNRTSSHRKALFQNLAKDLIVHEQIQTTVAKAKELRPIVEKLVTLGKRGDLNSRRIAISRLNSNSHAQKLFEALATRYKERNGGYTRIIKTGKRHGDNAPTAIIEFVDRDIFAKGASDIARVEAERAELAEVAAE